jgi:hypothetical protein
MDWVEHEIKCKLHRKYSVSCKKSSCWQVPRPLRSYCSYIDFLHGEYAFSYNSPSYENVIGSEVNYVLKNTAKDMINLFGWNHSALHVLHPKEAL